MVERAFDGNKFEKIGERPAIANSTANDYELMHPTPRKQTAWYRLKIVAANGSIEYSKIVLLKYQNSNTYIESVGPSPFVQSLDVAVKVDAPQNLLVQLLDVSGRKIRSLNSMAGAGTNHIAIDGLGKLPRGIYTIRIQPNKSILTQKVLK